MQLFLQTHNYVYEKIHKLYMIINLLTLLGKNLSLEKGDAVLTTSFYLLYFYPFDNWSPGDSGEAAFPRTSQFLEIVNDSSESTFIYKPTDPKSYHHHLL